MSAPYKVAETIQYTEIVFYSGDDEEVARERVHDDSTVGASAPQQLEDYFPDLLDEALKP